MNPNELRVKQQELKELEEMLKIKEGLPHLFGFPFYKWAREVWESNNPEIFLCAANQISKSSTAIRKNIRLATEPTLWPKFWPNLPRGTTPNLFWYFYPTRESAQIEFETKWEPQFLPRGEFKNHPQFGWQEEYDKGYISKIRFNTGVQIVFRTYSMKVKDLQTASVYHVTADEEMPVEYLPEIKARLNATEGLFLMVFTATLGQLYWSQTMEPPTKADEKHPHALKLQVSLYDCLEYEDGSPSPWTPKKIEAAKANCPTDAEIQRRIYGKFVKSSGLRIEGFSLERNMTDKHPLPKSWSVYGGVDGGSGGLSGSPAGIVFLAVSPDGKQGRVFRAWRGDGVPTTAGDIYTKYKEMKKDLTVVQERYDFSDKDFFLIQSADGGSFVPADKGRDAGFGRLNTLFKAGILKIQRGDPELDKLVQEICTLAVDADKKRAMDHLIDALRYAVMAVPNWDFSGLDTETNVQEELKKEKIKKPEPTLAERRMAFVKGIDLDSDAGNAEFGQEFDYWNELAGVFEE